MNCPQIANLIFAQISNWQRLGDGLHRNRGRMDLVDLLPVGIVLVVIGVVIAVVVKVRQRNDMSQPCNDPDKLFRELSLAHKIDGRSQRLLRQLADAFQLSQPAEVFLQPALFQSDQLPESLEGQEARIAALREQLF